MGRELNPEKVIEIKDKKIFYLLSNYHEDERYNCYLNLLSYYSEDEIYNCYLNLLSYNSEDERYNCYYLNMLSYYSGDKDIFTSCDNMQVSYILINTWQLHIN